MNTPTHAALNVLLLGRSAKMAIVVTALAWLAPARRVASRDHASVGEAPL